MKSNCFVHVAQTNLCNIQNLLIQRIYNKTIIFASRAQSVNDDVGNRIEPSQKLFNSILNFITSVKKDIVILNAGEICGNGCCNGPLTAVLQPRLSANVRGVQYNNRIFQPASEFLDLIEIRAVGREKNKLKAFVILL